MRDTKHCPRCHTDKPRTSAHWYIGARGNVTTGFCRACHVAYDQGRRRRARRLHDIPIPTLLAWYAALEHDPYCRCGRALAYSVDRLGRLVETCQRCDTVTLTQRLVGNPDLPDPKRVEVVA